MLKPTLSPPAERHRYGDSRWFFFNDLDGNPLWAESKPASGARNFGSNHRLLLVGPLTSSYLQFTKGPKHHFHGSGDDLIAGHYHACGSPPAMQFRNTKVARYLREG
jgi:hypothetical protein